MTLATAYWCILAVVVLPYLWTIIAKRSGERFNNKDPRGWMARQDTPRIRYANGAQLNSFEGNPVFITGVILAQLAGVPEQTIALCAVIYLVARIIYGVMYILGQHYVRSLVWFIGIGTSFFLIAQAAMHIRA